MTPETMPELPGLEALAELLSVEAVGLGGAVKYVADKFARRWGPPWWAMLALVAVLCVAGAVIMHGAAIQAGAARVWIGVMVTAIQGFLVAVALTDEHNRARELAALREATLAAAAARLAEAPTAWPADFLERPGALPASPAASPAPAGPLELAPTAEALAVDRRGVIPADWRTTP